MRQQASNLLPRTLTNNRLSQVVNLVRTKTARTLQSRLIPTNNVTIKNVAPPESDSNRQASTMVQEDQQKDEAECQASDVQTAESAEQTAPLTTKTTLLRSETFELTSPDKDCTISLDQGVHNTVTMLKTSSPNCNTSPAKRKFGSFGESSHIFNSSEIPEPDKTLVIQNDFDASMKVVKETLSNEMSTPKGCNTFLKQISNSDISNISPCGATVSEQSTLGRPSGDSTVVLQSTMVQEQPKLIDITTNVAPTFKHNPWNITEVVTANNVTHILSGNPESTIVLNNQPMELLMDVDEPEDLVDNGK